MTMAMAMTLSWYILPISISRLYFVETRRLLRRSLRLPKRKWAQGQAGL